MKEQYFVITQTHVIGSAATLEDMNNINNTYNLTYSFKWTALLSYYACVHSSAISKLLMNRKQSWTTYKK